MFGSKNKKFSKDKRYNKRMKKIKKEKQERKKEREENNIGPKRAAVPKEIGKPVEFDSNDSSSNYKRIKKLGEGSTGEVVLVERDGKSYAQKKVRIFNVQEKNRTLFGELNVLKIADSPFLLKLESVFEENGMVFMMLEYMEYGDLRNILYKLRKKIVKVEEHFVAKIAYSMLEGLSYLNKMDIEGTERKGILHRDLKPGNVLINGDGECKLADFGMAGVNKKINKTALGTYLYMSPERFNGLEHTFNSDIWSLGLIVVELVLQKLPNNIEITQEVSGNVDIFEIYQMLASLETQNKLLPEASEELQDFVGKCLKMKKEERANADELLEHPFITKNLKKEPSLKEWFKEIKKGD